MRFNLLLTSRTLAAAGLLLVPAGVFGQSDPAGHVYVSDSAPVYGEAPADSFYCNECGNYHSHHEHGQWLHEFKTGYHTPFHVWLHQNGSRTHSPDHGYRRPTKLPI